MGIVTVREFLSAPTVAALAELVAARRPDPAPAT
jgi:hypothetical protein